MSSKKRIKKRKDPAKSKSSGSSGLTLSAYEVTDEPMEHQSIARLPAKVRDGLEDLYPLLRRKPKEAISRLTDLVEKYPDVPLFYNLLSAAYLKIGDQKMHEEITTAYYNRYPHYLFGKISYALLCINKGDLDQIPVIFNNKFELSALYPGRKKFHISEFINFGYVMAVYFHKIGQKEVANTYYQALVKADPNNEVTRNLKTILYPSILTRILRKIFRVKQIGYT